LKEEDDYDEEEDDVDEELLKLNIEKCEGKYAPTCPRHQWQSAGSQGL